MTTRTTRHGEPRVTPRTCDELIVALDGSELAARALPVAELLAGYTGARIVPTTVVPTSGDVSGTVPGVGPAAILTADKPADALVDHVREQPGRVLVMSTHGRGRLVAGVLGSVAESVLRQLTEPVVLVGPAAPPAGPATLDRIVVCLDGSPSSERILPVAVAWAGGLGLRLDLVQVITPKSLERGEHAIASGDVMESGYLSGIARRWSAHHLRIGWEVLHGDGPVEPILRFADARTLLALTTHGRSGWSRLVMGSVAMRLAHESPTPLLALRPTTKKADER